MSTVPESGMTPVGQDKHALVLTGGGARAAYQVGCLRYISRAIPEYRPQILTGASAGAINAVHLAASDKPWRDSVEELRDLWLNLSTDRVYITKTSSLAKRVFVWGLRVISGGRLGRSDIRGMVDNAPLRQYLGAHLPLEEGSRIGGIADNIKQGWLDYLAIITTNYGSGRAVAWVEGLEDNVGWAKGQLRGYPMQTSLDHVMASSALPMFFPAVRLEDMWHGDGGIRLNSPLGPARHLGATRILAVSPRAKPVHGLPPDMRDPYPSPAQIAGVMLNSVFLDNLDYDADQMSRINRLLGRIPKDEHGEFRPIDVLVLRPREDLGKLAREHEVELPSSFRFFESGLNNRNKRSSDTLSMVIFEREYLSLLMRLGEEDAAARHDEIVAFLAGDSCSV
ncbi:MAG: patatin-like phospholipase family protein [Pseudomonadota bacterium]